MGSGLDPDFHYVFSTHTPKTTQRHEGIIGLLKKVIA